MFRFACLLPAMLLASVPVHAAGLGNIIAKGAEVAGYGLAAHAGYRDAQSGQDQALQAAAEIGVITAVVVTYTVVSAKSAGAAATAVVTAAVGGPVVMGGILVGTSAVVSYGAYKGGQALWRWVSDD